MLAPAHGVVGDDPYRAMLRGGLWPASAAAAVSTVVFVIVDGALGLAGGLFAAGVVLASFASSVLLLGRLRRQDPRVVFLAAMVGYVTKVGLLGIVLILFRHAEWLSPLAFAVTAIVASLAWTIGEVVAFSRVRMLLYDEPPAPGTAR